MSKDRPQVFYAYPSNPPMIGENIKEFAKQIRQGGLCEVKTWEDMDISGLRITKQITKKIDECDIFACDLTVLNLNVLFELGYAIAKEKKIFISLNPEMEGAEAAYRAFSLLTNIGYQRYHNVADLVGKFYESKIYERSYLSLASEESLLTQDEPIDIFALKADSRYDAVNRSIEAIEETRLERIIDDPSESPSYPLRWYSRNVSACSGFLCQFMSPTQKNSLRHNIKAALVSGIAYGLDKNHLFIAQTPFEIPSDLPDFLKTYSLASESYKITSDWAAQIKSDKQLALKRREDYRKSAQGAHNLKKLRLGEIVAENEQSTLLEYFIETGAYTEIIHGTQTIYVGRKGTGKSANLLAAETYFQSQRSNLVITIKPVGYEVENLVKVLSSLEALDKKDFFIESLWKYLIYTEIAEKLVLRYRNDPALHAPANEKALLDYLNKNDQMSDPSFSERINRVVRAVTKEIEGESLNNDLREVIGRVLFSGLMRDMKRYMHEILSNFSTVVILVDNLDKAWTKDVDVAKMADVVFGLLSMTRILPQEINREVKSKFGLDVKMAIFLRSDIYSVMLEYAKERDKLEIHRIEWDDEETLERVVDERLMYYSGKETPEEAWSEYFDPTVDNISTRHYIRGFIRPRPRDALVVLKESISSAVSRGHSKVKANDVKTGVKKYSRWAYDSVLAEDDPSRAKLKIIIDEFVNDIDTYSEEEIMDILSKKTSSLEESEFYLELLCDSHFLEIETQKDVFRLVEDPDERRNKLRLARKRASSENRPMRYRVSKPFHIWLEIADI